MGLFSDIKSRVVLEYKAEVEDAKRALRDLTGEQKKQAQAAVTGVEDQIKAHERLASKITFGMGIAAGAIALGVNSFNHYADTVRLRSATVGVDMGRLRDASHGLLTDMELMQVAAQGLNGRFKLTSDELEVVLGASVQLQRMGILPLTEATQKLGEAVRKGEVEPLKDLGLAYDENLAKTDKRAAALKALGELSAQSAAGTRTEAEAMQAHGAAFRSAMEQIQVAIGSLVASMEPLIGAAAKLTGLIADSISGWAIIVDTLVGTGDPAELESLTRRLNFSAANVALGSIARARLAQFSSDQGAYSEYQRSRAEEAGNVDFIREARLRAQLQEAEDFKTRRKYKGRTGGGGFELKNYAEIDGETWIPLTTWDSLIDQINVAGIGRGLDGLPMTDAARGDTSESDALLNDGPRKLFRGAGQGFAAKAMKAQSERKVTDIMERLFGSKEQFDVYATGWGMVKDAALSAYDAMVTGSESAGAAIKKALAGSIHGVGQKMFVRGLEETAEGVASLLFNPAAAGQHFAAAGLFFAGSATAGAVASALGGGGGSAAGRGSGASASGVGLGGRSAPNTPINRTYVIGDSFWYSSPRQQAAMFSSMDRRAQSFEPPPTGVAYS